MTDLDALLAGVVTHPREAVRWLIVADWLDDYGFADRAELLRLHRMLIDTCCEPDAHPERAAWQARIVELIDQGVTPCVPQHTLTLPGGVPLVGHFIPPGSFLMGSEDGDDNEMPVHKVTLTKGFFMGIYPVTQAQWRAVQAPITSRFQGDDLPVDGVYWSFAEAYCNKLAELVGVRVRLPTEAEWEYACRAGTTTHFHYGDSPHVDRMNYCGSGTWNGSSSGVYRGETTKVDLFPPNAWGLFDCHGNVHEWCSGWFVPDSYAGAPPRDPVVKERDDDGHVERGGCL